MGKNNLFFHFPIIRETCSKRLVHFFRFEKNIYFFIFLLFLHLCNRNSLAGLVNFFRFEKKKICSSIYEQKLIIWTCHFFLYSYCFYIERNSLPGLLNIFTHFHFRI